MNNKFKFKHKMSDTIYHAEREGENFIITTDEAEIEYPIEMVRENVKQGEWTIIPANYEETGKTIGKLVDKKNAEYGDSFNKAGEYLKILYPDGIKPDQYHSMLALARDFDKSMRIANGNQGEENAWTDKGGYSLLMAGKS